jgi:HK97 family phage major capsid protein
MGKAPAGIKTGNKEVDGLNDDAWSGGPGHADEQNSPLKSLYLDALTKGHTFSVGRAVKQLVDGKRLKGMEGEVDVEMARRMGRPAKGFWVPWDCPVRAERRSLTVSVSPGSVTAQIPYMMMIDVLRPKLAIARLGGRILNLIGDGPRGTVQLPTKSAASTISWVSEGAAPASEANPTIQGFTMMPYTATAYTDVTRRMMLLGSDGFEDHIINDLMVGIAVAVDGAAINGSSGVQPLGIFQLAGMPSIGAHGDTGNGGTITYSNLVAMNQIVGLYNGDSPATARMGWLTTPQGKATLSLTDKSSSASTGRFCWESHLQIVDGVERTVEHILGYSAVATTLAPSALTEGSSSNITALVHGNFDNAWINLFSGFDCLVNPFLQSVTGVTRISAFQDVDFRLVRPESFCICGNIAPIVPQTT